MKTLLIVILYVNCTVAGISQSNSKPFTQEVEKKLIDTGMLGSWPLLLHDQLRFSGDGKYVSYVYYEPESQLNTLVIQNVSSTWKKIVTGENLSSLFFNANSNRFYWRNGDSLFCQLLGDSLKQLVGVAKSFKYPSNNGAKWLAFEPKSEPGMLHLIDLSNGKLTIFQDVTTYLFERYGNVLLLSQQTIQSEKKFCTLTWINLNDNNSKIIWRGENVSANNFVFDNSSKQLCFLVIKNDNAREKEVWYYKNGTTTAKCKISYQQSRDINLSSISNFSNNDEHIFFILQKGGAPNLQDSKNIASVDIWSYRDPVINPRQKFESVNISRVAAYNIDKDVLVNVANENEICYYTYKGFDKHVLVAKRNFRPGTWWPHSEKDSCWMVSLVSGERKLMKELRLSTATSFQFSPQGQWFIYWDSESRNYFSYNIKNGKTSNITNSLPHPVVNENNQDLQRSPVGLAGWYQNDSLLLVYDDFDIWQVDPSGNKMPLNITSGYGRRSRIKFRVCFEFKNQKRMVYQGNESVLLTAFNVDTKYNGFYRMNLGQIKVLQKLTMGPYTYFLQESQHGSSSHTFGEGTTPLQSADTLNPSWVVTRHNSKEYPNYYFTKDLRSFTPVTHFHPNTSYKWLSVELIKWKMFDGKICHGVLYKPEDFDPRKKYPVIVNYYEKLSYRLNQFPQPQLATDNINIPWFVSRDYLVFTPDIHYTIASEPNGRTTGESAYNSVVSGTKFLKTLPFIDKDRIAIQGHSFGGQETAFLVTHSNEFAAASEMAGTTDYISAYLTLVGDNQNEYIHKMDHHQGRIDATPWQRPDLYIRQSPVLYADKVKAPLLIIHNKKDGSINFRQGVEMYMALRRLTKACWLLQYDNSGHTMKNDVDALDYTIRLTQFFNHYLKNAPAPAWMTMNTLAAYKGKNNLYEYNPYGNCGRDCKVCKEWNEKMKKDPESTLEEIEEKSKTEHWQIIKN